LYAQRVLQKTGYGYNTFHKQKGGESIVGFHESEVKPKCTTCKKVVRFLVLWKNK